jgi:hypothetical protein
VAHLYRFLVLFEHGAAEGEKSSTFFEEYDNIRHENFPGSIGRDDGTYRISLVY